MTKLQRIRKQLRADVQSVDDGIDQILRVGDIAAIEAWNRLRSAVLRACPQKVARSKSSSSQPTSRRLPRPSAADGVQFFRPETA